VKNRKILVEKDLGFLTAKKTLNFVFHSIPLLLRSKSRIFSCIFYVFLCKSFSNTTLREKQVIDMTNPWHVVRIVNFLLSLPPIQEYQLFFVRGDEGQRHPFTRLVWCKDHFRIRMKQVFYLYLWMDIGSDDRIEDSYGHVFLRGSDLNFE
jgi:hypothetical protein